MSGQITAVHTTRNQMKITGALRLVVLFMALGGFILLRPGPARGQESPDLQSQAESLLQTMTVSERIGQLFLVTFEGDRAPGNSAIADLILNYHIGGVALLSENDNLTGYGDPAATPAQVQELTGNLQRLALRGFSNEPPGGEADDSVPPTPEPEPRTAPIPLIIATAHDGDSLPSRNVLAGYTAVPNNMALGATWEAAYAQRVGEIVGGELAATGVNMLFGPSLDVLERPAPLSTGDLGTAAFGGDPYWTGVLGRAYIEGVHTGGGSRLAVAARSFPGKGSSDRAVEEEVPTVRRSLEQLKQIELAPFFAVTRDAPGTATAADALLTTHIRYQGFQGNIRATTAPVSLDPQALNSLLALPEFAPWRQGGGVIVSDRLGARSVERFYNDTEREFPHRQIAKDALLAGNDVLYVADFALGAADEATQMANVKDTIQWFRGRYETDPTFQQRVDEAVRRILTLKLRLYGGDFTAETVIPEPVAGASPVEPTGSAAFFDIAEAAVTLLAPSNEELSGRLVSPPGIGDRLVIFTDVQMIESCSTCDPVPSLAQTALQERILAIYGPDGSGQVQADNISSFSFADLNKYLNAGTTTIPFPTAAPSTLDDTATQAPNAVVPDATPAPTATLPADYRVQEALRDADWLVFALLNGGARSGSADSGALSRFLAQRPDLAANSQVVVLAFDAPYFLDSTEISKLTAYYGIYSRTAAFVDAAVRALFLESPLLGAPPVSVEGIQYDLFTQTQPAPAQVIELFLVIGEAIEAPSSQQPLASAIGDTLRLQTGAITDHNGNTVPDGTLVRFMLRNRVQGTVTVLGDRPTVGGLAQLDYVLDASMGPGQFRITAESGEATVSQEVDIVIEDDAQLAIIIPTTAPSPTPTPQPTATATPPPTATLPPIATGTPEPPEPAAEPGWLIRLSELRALLGVLGGLLAIGVASTFADRRGAPPPSQRVGRLLWGLAGGLLLYNYYALGLPGAGVLAGLGSVAGLALVLVGGAGGLALYRPRQRV